MHSTVKKDKPPEAFKWIFSFLKSSRINAAWMAFPPTSNWPFWTIFGSSSDYMTTTDSLKLLYPLGVTSQNVYLPITNSCYFCYSCEYLLPFRSLLDSWPFVGRYFLACFPSLELWECIYVFLSLMSVYEQSFLFQLYRIGQRLFLCLKILFSLYYWLLLSLWSFSHKFSWTIELS